MPQYPWEPPYGYVRLHGYMGPISTQPRKEEKVTSGFATYVMPFKGIKRSLPVLLEEKILVSLDMDAPCILWLRGKGLL